MCFLMKLALNWHTDYSTFSSSMWVMITLFVVGLHIQKFGGKEKSLTPSDCVSLNMYRLSLDWDLHIHAPGSLTFGLGLKLLLSVLLILPPSGSEGKYTSHFPASPVCRRQVMGLLFFSINFSLSFSLSLTVSLYMIYIHI